MIHARRQLHGDQLPGTYGGDINGTDTSSTTAGSGSSTVEPATPGNNTTAESGSVMAAPSALVAAVCFKDDTAYFAVNVTVGAGLNASDVQHDASDDVCKQRAGSLTADSRQVMFDCELPGNATSPLVVKFSIQRSDGEWHAANTLICVSVPPPTCLRMDRNDSLPCRRAPIPAGSNATASTTLTVTDLNYKLDAFVIVPPFVATDTDTIDVFVTLKASDSIDADMEVPFTITPAPGAAEFPCERVNGSYDPFSDGWYTRDILCKGLGPAAEPYNITFSATDGGGCRLTGLLQFRTAGCQLLY